MVQRAIGIVAEQSVGAGHIELAIPDDGVTEIGRTGKRFPTRGRRFAQCFLFKRNFAIVPHRLPRIAFGAHGAREYPDGESQRGNGG